MKKLFLLFILCFSVTTLLAFNQVKEKDKIENICLVSQPCKVVKTATITIDNVAHEFVVQKKEVKINYETNLIKEPDIFSYYIYHCFVYKELLKTEYIFDHSYCISNLGLKNKNSKSS